MHNEAKRVKYQLEFEASVHGEVEKLREVCNAAIYGIEVNTTDIEGVEDISIKLVKATQTVEEEIDLGEEETPLV